MDKYNRRSRELRLRALDCACEFMPENDHAEALSRGKALADVVNELVNDHIAAARDAGMTWQQIADAMGISQQAAYKRGQRLPQLAH